MIDSFSKIVLAIAIGFAIGGITKGIWILIHNDWRGLPVLLTGLLITGVIVTTLMKFRNADN
jgi:hypothetical protein